MQPSPQHITAAHQALPPARSAHLNALALAYVLHNLVAPIDPADVAGTYVITPFVHSDNHRPETVQLHAARCTCWTNDQEGDCFHVRACLLFARASLLALEEAADVARFESDRAHTEAAFYTERLFSLQSQLQGALP